MLTIEMDLSEFHKLRDQTIQFMGISLSQVVFEAVMAGADYARQTHPHQNHSGALTGSYLHARLISSNARGAVGEIVNDAPYARFVELGTKPHVIRPKEGHGLIGPLRAGQSRRAKTDIGTHRKALRFIAGGKTVFASVVHHPGSAPKPFMEPAGKVAAEFIVAQVPRVVFVHTASLWE